MEIIIHGDKLKITPAMSNYIEEKLGKLEKYLQNSENIRANINVKVNGHKHRVEITIPLKTFILRSEETTEDFYTTIDKTIGKLERQIRKNKTRMVTKQSKTNYDFDLLSIEPDQEEKTEQKIVKRKSIEIKPMHEEEAIIQMELLSHKFYLYKDSDKNKLVVIYKRDDGNYGTIEAEE